jgi:toxin ParE1/3/4
MKLVWSPLARTQLLEAFSYIAERNVDAAAKVYERINERANSLVDFPELGHIGKQVGTRELTITGTQYVLVYRVMGDFIQIAAVWHGRQSRNE